MLPHDCPVCRTPQATRFREIDGKSYWRCGRCEATFLDPARRPDAASERREYLLHRNRIDDPHYRRFLSKLADPLRERLAPGSSGLDYGCGPGPALAAMLIAGGHSMTLYDPLFHDDPQALDATYDFVTCTEVAEHFHRPAEEFARLDRLLKPGGWLAVMTRFLVDDEAFANWHYRRDPTHVVFYREHTFLDIAGRFGWCCEFPCRDVALMRKPA